MSAPLKPYTVFCRQTRRVGTTWISTVEATTPKGAAKLGAKTCAEDWGYDRRSDVECYCVIEGDVKVALFID